MSQIVVLDIPHSARRTPAEERQAVFLDDTELQKELLRMTDAYTDELFPLTPVEAARVVFPISRLICDVERFPSDETEPMATRGYGCHLYSHIERGRPSNAGNSSISTEPLVLAASFSTGAYGQPGRYAIWRPLDRGLPQFSVGRSTL